MGDDLSSHCAFESSKKIPLSDSKMVIGLKRRGEDLEEDSHVSRKQIKIRDLQSVLQSEVIDTSEPGASQLEETEEHMDIVETQSSQVLDKNAVENAEARHLEGGSINVYVPLGDRSGSMPLDLNTEVCTDENSGYNNAVVSLDDSRKHSSCAKAKGSVEHNYLHLGGNRLDLNVEDVASSVNHDSLYTCRSQNGPKVRETSDSGRTTGRLDDKDALKKWKEMKKNGFMSSSYGYGGIPPPPKQRGRKGKNEVLKQKMEQAKKEQVDRFTKIAAPSGLLNGLNPGIINHVRNSKQVHSIIQALVRSEKRENRRQASEMRAGSGELNERITEQGYVNFTGVHGSGLSYAVSSFSLMPESTLPCENQFSHNNSALYNSEDRNGCGDSVAEEQRCCAKTSFFSYPENHSEDDILALKLASSTKVTESTSCVSNEESANGSSVDTLSVKAATVASQWLQLMHQDIKGRLAALRRSKKRVRAVITTELPFLLSKEFPSNQENIPDAVKDFASGYPTKATAEMHQSHWGKLFNQMDSALSDEEKQLESWLNRVNKMMLHCDQGLQHIQWSTILEMQHMGMVDNDLRSKLNDPENDLSVRAAAASIYSTCNFLSSRENVSCC
ncbi:uncharacterized protein LOC104887626 isoform X1 [Beta vulgaris subsp. vulgaris]|uniref:uncharacterized protein LOC104887626 isoform X1 n=2 Tax=Beta vulgaris subsp. vulgaris TaxID=3555 RepID=UPI0020368003|nr:uncharacterized protein LOC104887626 isoform X1 [Beta vulgaris subsp. vulgaris]